MSIVRDLKASVSPLNEELDKNITALWDNFKKHLFYQLLNRDEVKNYRDEIIFFNGALLGIKDGIQPELKYLSESLEPLRSK